MFFLLTTAAIQSLKHSTCKRLQKLLGSRAGLDELRWQLVHALRDGTMALENQELQTHLRSTVANQIAIDQPRYSGLKTALAYSG